MEGEGGEESKEEIENEEADRKKKSTEKKNSKLPNLKDKTPEEIAEIMAKQLLEVSFYISLFFIYLFIYLFIILLNNLSINSFYINRKKKLKRKNKAVKLVTRNNLELTRYHKRLLSYRYS